MIESNIIHHAFEAGDTLTPVGSSCIYPKAASQPMAEEALLTGPLEPINEPYAVPDRGYKATRATVGNSALITAR